MTGTRRASYPSCFSRCPKPRAYRIFELDRVTVIPCGVVYCNCLIPQHTAASILKTSMRRRLIRRAILISRITAICALRGDRRIPHHRRLFAVRCLLYDADHHYDRRLSGTAAAKPRRQNFQFISDSIRRHAMFLAVGAMTQTVIELELQDRFGERRKKRMISKLHDHFIVCGFGRVGRNASYELQRGGASFLVVDRNEERV